MSVRVNRMQKVDAQLQRLISQLILNEYDAGHDLVTVTGVHTTRDLKQAQVVITATERMPQHVAALNRMARNLRELLKPQLDFKIIPALQFQADDKGEEITRVEALLDRIV